MRDDSTPHEDPPLGDPLRLQNPIRPPSDTLRDQHSTPFQDATLIGTMPDESQRRNAVAFIRFPDNGIELVAFQNGPIWRNGQLYEPLRGWTLVNMGKDWARFTKGTASVTLSVGCPRY